MNWHIFSEVNSFVSLDSSLASDEWITLAFLVNTLFKFSNDGFLHDINVWHQTLYEICGDNLKTDIHIPLGHVIGEWTIESLPEFLRLELLQVGVYNKNNEPSVEELTQESTLYDGSFLLRYSILTNPADKHDDTKLQDCIDNNNNDSN